VAQPSRTSSVSANPSCGVQAATKPPPTAWAPVAGDHHTRMPDGQTFRQEPATTKNDDINESS
jgi:hypothetical protein